MRYRFCTDGEVVVMADLLRYIACVVVGFFIGTALRKRRIALPWTARLQTAIIAVIIVAMGIRMGANREITENLGEIGLSALILTVLALIFTIVGLYAVRKMMGIDRYGHLKNETAEKKSNTGEKAEGHINKMTVLILIAITAGMLIGRFVPVMTRADPLLGTAINAGLCLLLVSVGLDLGTEESGTQNVKAVGARVVVFPIVTAICTLSAGILGGVLLRMNVAESMAIVSGFSWYTLTPGLIMDAGFLQAGAIALLSNILREVFSFILIPVVAKTVGYIECIGMAGAAAMDVCLPIVERSTSADVAVYSLVSGMVLSMMVPLLTPLILAFA